MIETEIYLFPGQSEGGYGVFLGGLKLDEEPGPSYDVFLLRWDGAHARGNWISGQRMPSAAFRPEMSQHVVKGLPDKPVKNVLSRSRSTPSDDESRVAQFHRQRPPVVPGARCAAAARRPAAATPARWACASTPASTSTSRGSTWRK